MKKIKITERDVEILKFINQFGFCEMGQLEKRFDLKKPRNYQVMNRLVDAGLIYHVRLFHLRHGIYRVTKLGAKFTDLPMLERLSLATYQHELTVIEVVLQLCRRYSEATFVSERQLKQQNFVPMLKRVGHLPDGLWLFPDGKQVALEVELSLKGNRRLDKILKNYATQLDLQEVWYVCTDKVASVITPLIAKMPFIKVLLIKEVLA